MPWFDTFRKAGRLGTLGERNRLLHPENPTYQYAEETYHLARAGTLERNPGALPPPVSAVGSFTKLASTGQCQRA